MTRRNETPRRLAAQVGRMLRAVTREHDWEGSVAVPGSASPDFWADFVAGAERHRVVGCAYLSLRYSPDAPKAVVEQLQAAYRLSLAAHLRSVTDLRLVAAALGEIPWLTFKGAVLAEAIYSRPDLRSYTDVDVLVDNRQFGSALERLEAHGFRTLDCNWTMIRAKMLGEVHLRAPFGSLIDLHWQLLNNASRRERYALDPQLLLARRRPLVVGHTEVPTLSAADTVVHLCLHASASGGDRLGWLKDVEQAMRSPELAYADIAAASAQMQCRRSTAVMLSRTYAVLGGRPSDLERCKLDPSRSWQLLERIAERCDPVPRAMGHNSLSYHVARVSYDGRGESWQGLRGALVAATRQRRSTGGEPLSDESILYPTGGAAGREEFVRAVEQWRPAPNDPEGPVPRARGRVS